MNTIDILNMSEEFDKNEGIVTCEFSIHSDFIQEFETFVLENTNIKFGKWVLIECDTCVEQCGEGYLHASIEKNESIKNIEGSSNHIKTIR